MREIIGLENLVSSICQCTEISDTEALLTLQKFFFVLERGLVEENYVRIKGLGIFKLIDVDNRKSVSVQSGKEIEIESHKKVSFSVDSALKDFLNKPYSHYEVVELSEMSTSGKEAKTETEDNFLGDRKELNCLVTKRETSYRQVDKDSEKEGRVNRVVMWIILFLLSLLMVFGFLFLMLPEILEQLLYG